MFDNLKTVSYSVWITTLTDSYTDAVAGRLVRRNWNVASLGDTLSLRTDDNMTTMLAFSMTKTPKSDKPEDQINLQTVIAEVKDVLKRLGVKYHSVVVTQYTGATWVLGNITKSEIAAIELDKKGTIN